MVKTTFALMKHFPQASCGYTGSDEITLAFPSLEVETTTTTTLQEEEQEEEKTEEDQQQQIPFGGRIQKLVSLAASFCSVQFNHYLSQETFVDTQHGGDDSEKLLSKVRDGLAYFDARAFNLPSTAELANNVLWRSRIDCTRNSKSLLGTCHFTQRQIEGVPADQVVRMLRDQRGIDWNTMPEEFKWGSFVKREMVEQIGFNPVENRQVVAIRRKLVAKSFALPLAKKHAALVERLVVEPLWNPELMDEISLASKQELETFSQQEQQQEEEERED